MNTVVQTGPRGLLPELLDWLELPTGIRPRGQVVRFEEFTKDDRYVLRAELPGIDPESDVEITVTNGVLTVHGERREEEREQYRTEFRYGSFTRSITMPQGIDPEDVTATYDKGILEVSVGLKRAKEDTRRIRVETS